MAGYLAGSHTTCAPVPAGFAPLMIAGHWCVLAPATEMTVNVTARGNHTRLPTQAILVEPAQTPPTPTPTAAPAGRRLMQGEVGWS